MKFLLTADIHLKADHPERLQALERIIELCESKEVNYLLIAGDLFDANVDVEDVKPDVRELFSDNSFHTYAIPGNHDKTAFRKEDYFGDDIDLLKEKPVDQRELDGVNLVAVPYFDGEFDDIIEELDASAEDNELNILLMHSTLAGFGGGFGEESRYLPVTPEQLLPLPYDYVFSGHIHTSPTKKDIGDRMVFVYPGSPVSITRDETGPRGAWLLDTEATEDALTSFELETFHYESVRLNLRPGEVDDELSTLESRLASKRLDDAHLIVELAGFIEREEESFFTDVDAIIKDADPLKSEVDQSGIRSVKSIVEMDLYQKFREKLDEREDIDQESVEKAALEAFARYSRG